MNFKIGEIIKIKGIKRQVGVVSQSTEEPLTWKITIHGRYVPAPKSILQKKRSPFSKHKMKIL